MFHRQHILFCAFIFRVIFLFASVLFITSCRPTGNQEETEQAEEEEEFSQIPFIQKLNEKIEQSPGDAELYFIRSNAYVQLGNYNNALSDVRQALELDSTVGKYYGLLAEIFFTNEEFTRALTALEKGRSEAPDDMELALQLAKYYLYVGERAKSIQLLDEVLRKNIFNAQAYFLKGMIFKEIGDTAKSVSNFQTAVEQNPRYYEAYMQLGLLLSKKNDRLALDYLNNALKVNPESYEAHYGIAYFHQQVEEYEKALELYREMILNFPRNKDAYYNVGYIHFQLDSFDRASRDFDRAISVAPDYADAYYMRGLCAEVKKDFKNAKYYYQQTLNLKAEHALALEGMKRASPRPSP